MKTLLQMLLATSVLVGCGLPLEGEEDPAWSAAPVTVTPGAEPRPVDRVFARSQAVAARPMLQVDGTGSFQAGLRMTVVTGFLACGFAETGRATTETADGTFSLRVPQQPSYGLNAVLVWVDLDGDGQCTATDTTVMVDLGYSSPSFSGIDLTKGSSAGCYWFQ